MRPDRSTRASAQPVLAHAELEGAVASLRPLVREDAEPAFAMLHGHDEILRWLVWNGPRNAAELEPFYARWATRSATGCDYHFAICDRATGAFRGCIGPRFLGHPRLGDVGYWIASDAWGRGLGTDALRLVCHLCFEHLDAALLYAYVFVGNAASRRVLERVGFRYEYLARGKVLKHGEPVDEWYFTLAPDEWRAAAGGWRPEREVVRLEDVRLEDVRLEDGAETPSARP